MGTNFYHVILFAVAVFAGMFILLYLLYRHFVQKIEQQKNETIQAILQAQEQERRVIALEVHDNLGPLLSITNLQVEALMEEDTGPMQKRLGDILTQLKNAVYICREISHELTPFLNNDADLEQIVTDYVQKINSAGRLHINFNYPSQNLAIQRPKSASICRIILELVTNTLKHARAQTADIDISIQNNVFVLVYKDDGVGMRNVTNNGIGIKNIQSRVQLLKGTIQPSIIGTNGYLVKIKIPLKELM